VIIYVQMETGVAEDLIRDGWHALAEADWDAARSCFERAGELRETAETLDGLGRALHFQGDYPRAIDVTERAFAAYRKEGMTVDAADRARWLAFLHGAINSNMAVAGGWMERAASLLEDTEECAGHGWLVLDRARLPTTPKSVIGSPGRRWRSRGASVTSISSTTRSRCSANRTWPPVASARE
jgi:tetratricopeptide (TPR) repeat protein